jgi:hypothetical protein
MKTAKLTNHWMAERQDGKPKYGRHTRQSKGDNIHKTDQWKNWHWYMRGMKNSKGANSDGNVTEWQI